LENRYSIDSKDREKLLIKPLFKILFIDLAVIIFIGIIYEFDFKVILWPLIGIFSFTLIFYILPLVLLYRNYLKYNSCCELIFDFNKDETINIRFSSSNKEITFNEADILKINSNLSFTEYDKRMAWFFWDYLFFYNELVLSNNERIIISSLLCDKLLIHLNNTKINRVRRFFPMIRTVGNNAYNTTGSMVK
tara:strand:+ start:92 stop:667 length:576 start_codon:yes stop_codon:yes gene_type:complete